MTPNGRSMALIVFIVITLGSASAAWSGGDSLRAGFSLWTLSLCIGLAAVAVGDLLLARAANRSVGVPSRLLLAAAGALLAWSQVSPGQWQEWAGLVSLCGGAYMFVREESRRRAGTSP